MAVVAAGTALAWASLKDVPLDARVVQVPFMGLAALTVPHRLVVERAGVRKAAQG